MSLFPERFRQRVGAFIEAIDPPPVVRRVGNFGEFEALSRRSHAGVVDAMLIVEETSPNQYKLHTSYASWRGDQADKVVVDEVYEEGFRGRLEENESAWQIIRLKMALAAEKRLRAISGLLPRAEVKTQFHIKKIDGSGGFGIIDYNQRNALYDEATRRGLIPLTPVQPASS